MSVQYVNMVRATTWATLMMCIHLCCFISLRLGKNDLLTFYDGDDLTANILGQYSGFLARFRLYTSTADVTIQFQSDPASNIYGYNNGFVVHFFGKWHYENLLITFTFLTVLFLCMVSILRWALVH